MVKFIRPLRDKLQDDEEALDGETIHVPTIFMDGRRSDARDHHPHFAELTDEVRKIKAATRAEYLAGLQDKGVKAA